MHDNASEIVLQVMGVAGLFFIFFLIYTLYQKLYDKDKKTSHIEFNPDFFIDGTLSPLRLYLSR